MKKNDFGSVRLLLALENLSIRQALQNALQHEGFPRPYDVASLDRLAEAIDSQTFDVVVTATDLAGQFVPPVLGRLRQGRLPHHPLPVVIALLTSMDADYVTKVIDCGPDDLLQLPISSGQLLNRLTVLAETRKPFVVTSDYVGPDRRQNLRPGTAAAPQTEVPNPLQMRMARLSEETFLFEMRAAAEKLRQMRLERFAFELQWLLRAIRQLFQPEQNDEAKLRTFCERIKTLLLAMAPLLKTEEAAKLQPLSDKLAIGANIILKNGFSADATVLNGVAGLVNNLTQTIRATLPADILEAAGLPQNSAGK